MLSRTANHLFWLSRYMERAENMARLLDVGLRMSLSATDDRKADSEWHSTIVASGCEESFYDRYEIADARSAIDHLIRDQDNPSSVLSCLRTARQNSRAVRTALTVDMWNAVNTSWLEAQSLSEDDFDVTRIRRVLDWIKDRSLLLNGAIESTQLRNDAHAFTRLGTFLERADNTARILDVKYHVLLPEYERVGGTVDYYQWAAILRSVSARRSYHWIYHRRLEPWLVAELLILRAEMPRSLVSCFKRITGYLDDLAGLYGNSGECHRLAGQIHARYRYGKIADIFRSGLHEFLTDAIDSHTVLGDELSRQYLS